MTASLLSLVATGFVSQSNPMQPVILNVSTSRHTGKVIVTVTAGIT